MATDDAKRHRTYDKKNDACDCTRTFREATTPFYDACSNGDVDAVRLMLGHGKTDVNLRSERSWSSGYSHVCDCCRGKYMWSDCNISSSYELSESPLNAACKWGHLCIIDLLLSYPETDVNNGCTLKEDEDNEDLFNTKFEYVVYNHQCTPLSTACKYQRSEAVIRLLQHSDTKRRLDVNLTSPLQHVCRRQSIEILRILLQDERVDPDAVFQSTEVIYTDVEDDDDADDDANHSDHSDHYPMSALDTAFRLENAAMVNLILRHPRTDVSKQRRDAILSRGKNNVFFRDDVNAAWLRLDCHKRVEYADNLLHFLPRLIVTEILSHVTFPM